VRDVQAPENGSGVSPAKQELANLGEKPGVVRLSIHELRQVPVRLCSRAWPDQTGGRGAISEIT